MGCLAGLALAGCGGGGAGLPSITDDQTVISAVQVLPNVVTVAIGQSVQLQLVATDQAGHPVAGGTVRYQVADPTLASVDTRGLVTGLAAGGTILTATVTWQGSSKSATATIEVTAPPAPGGQNVVTTPGTSFLPASLSIQANDSVTWEFSGAIHNVTFTSSAPPGGNVTDRNPGSRVTRVFPTAGSYPYECTRHAGMAATITVLGTQPAAFTSLTVSPTGPAIAVGGTVQLTATARDQFGTAMPSLPAPVFTTSAATVATVTTAGVVTGVGAGTATITASVTSGGVTHTGSATVTVSVPTSSSVTVTTPGNSFAPATATIPVGGTVTWQFSGTHNVTFATTAPAGGNIPDQTTGNAVSRTFAMAGSYDYQCTRHNGMNGRVVVQAGSGGGSFATLALAPVSLVLSIGQTGQLVATPLDANGVPVTGLGSAGFSSSSPGVASVNSVGLVTAVASGAATITASLTVAGTTRTATAAITVAGGPVTTVTTPNNTFQPNDITVTPGTTVIWQISETTHNVTFENAAPPGGTIGDTPPGNAVARTFPTVGSYDYECTIHKGMKGRVRVQ